MTDTDTLCTCGHTLGEHCYSDTFACSHGDGPDYDDRPAPCPCDKFVEAPRGLRTALNRLTVASMQIRQCVKDIRAEFWLIDSAHTAEAIDAQCIILETVAEELEGAATEG